MTQYSRDGVVKQGKYLGAALFLVNSLIVVFVLGFNKMTRKG